MIFSKSKPLATVAFNMRPKRGPYGGGNQWLTQVSPYLERCGYAVAYDLNAQVDCVLGTHVGLSDGLTFSYEDVLRAKSRNPRLRCIQRINDNDARKGTGEMDRFLAESNRAADHTVFVSAWLRDYHASRWFDVTKPHSVITNGADPAIFHPVGAARWSGAESLRLVTHHWSDNPGKGFDVYAQLDGLIADGVIRDVELWIIGRWPKEISWRAARTFPPASGHALAAILRQGHVCITASRFEPGAMHPVESMQCGLPLLYHEDTGGTVELGEKFGEAFRDDLPAAVETIKTRYQDLRDRILREAPSGDLMAVQYRRVVQSLLCAS